MPPTLALVLCSGFVAVILRLERRQAVGVTGSLWVPTIWVLYVATKPLAVWLPWSGASSESSPLDRAFLIAIMIAAIWVIGRKGANWSGAIRDHPWLIALVFFMLASVFWSNLPKTSFIRWIRELQAVIMALAIFSEALPRKAIESLLRRIIYILLPFSILLIKYYPDYGIDYGRWTGERMWIGVAQQKNGLGLICLISSFFLVWSLLTKWKTKRKPVWKYEALTEIFFLILALWLFRGPTGSFFYSATSFYALCAGLLSYTGLSILKKKKKQLNASVIMIIMAVIMLAGIMILFTQGSHIGFVASAAGRSSTLTDRTEVWAALLPYAMKRPFLGYGFGGFWTPATKAFFHIDGAHSGYLDTLLGVGFLGLALTALFFIAAARNSHRLLGTDFEWGAFGVSFLVIALVHNIAESSVDSLTSLSTALILFLTVCSSKIHAGESP